MADGRGTFPDLARLTAGLEAVLAASPWAGRPPTVLERRPAVYSSTCPSEVVTCDFGGGERVKFLCKYAPAEFWSDHGHRGGLAYEGRIYERLLAPLRVTAPTCFGLHVDPEERRSWLVIEYLEGTLRCSQTRAFRGSMARAAAWAGRFHRAAAERVAAGEASFVRRYDAEYYLGWARRTAGFAPPELRARLPWLAGLLRRFEEVVPLLLDRPTTVVHGEYYPHNVLYRDGVIYPIDWETAAVGAGEIDLASLTEHWDEATVVACEEAYREARFTGGDPRGFPERLAAARLYVALRWLGDRPDWIGGPLALARFEGLAAAGRRLGLVGRDAP